MHPVTLLILLLAFSHSISMIFDIYKFRQSPKLQSHKLNLWLLIHAVGLNLAAYTFNYDLHQIIHTSFAFMPVPAVAIVQIFSGFILVSYLYIWMMNKFTILSTPRWIMPVLVTAFMGTVLMNLVMYNRVSYYNLQIITMIIIAFISLLAAYSISPALKQMSEKEDDPIRLIKFRWAMFAQGSAFISMILILGDAIWRLTQGIHIIYTPTYILAELLRQGMVISILIINRGRYLTLLRYPIKVLQYRHLKKLNDHLIRYVDLKIHSFEIDFPPPLPQHIDLLILRQYISILDIYLFLPEDSPLRQSIQRINMPDTDYDDNIKALKKISMEYAS